MNIPDDQIAPYIETAEWLKRGEFAVDGAQPLLGKLGRLGFSVFEEPGDPTLVRAYRAKTDQPIWFNLPQSGKGETN